MTSSIREDATNTSLIQNISHAIKCQRDMDKEFLHKKSKKIVTVQIKFHEREYFIDEKGIKWVRD